MQWFYQIPGVDDLEGAAAFFEFFSVSYEPAELQRRRVLVLSDFHRRLREAVPLRNMIGDDGKASWHLARRLLSESYQQLIVETRQ